jgi:heat shock protein HtpX
MDGETVRRQYARRKRRDNTVALLVFGAGSIVSSAAIGWLTDSAWTEWWVASIGVLVGFLVALACYTLMDYDVEKAYNRVTLSLREYVSMRFRFLALLFLLPVAISSVIATLLASTSYFAHDPFLLLMRVVLFIAAVLFSGYVLPYLVGRIGSARETQSHELAQIVDEVSGRMGVGVQGVYEVPLKGVRTANAAQLGFVRGRKAVVVIGEWQEHFTKDEMRAVLAHEFAHAKNNDVRKMVMIQAFDYIGLPGLLYIVTASLVEFLGIPKPLPTEAAVPVVALALVLVAATHLATRAYSRRRETKADQEAAAIAGPAAIASALRRLADLNMIPKDKGGPLSTHPSIDQRVEALQAFDGE